MIEEILKAEAQGQRASEQLIDVVQRNYTAAMTRGMTDPQRLVLVLNKAQEEFQQDYSWFIKRSDDDAIQAYDKQVKPTLSRIQQLQLDVLLTQTPEQYQAILLRFLNP